MAELVLSALVTVVFEKLTSVIENKVTRSKGIHFELKKWERKLSLIQAFLEDASQKEVTSKAVKRWLNDLQHLAYDIDDLLDTLATDAMHSEFADESQPITNKVRKFIPSCCTSFSLSTRVASKLDNISTRLQELMDEKDELGLSVKDGRSKNKNRVNQTSLVNLPSIVGRQEEKAYLLKKLLGDEPCDQNFSIVPIVGMGGIGKTTLARLLYDDKLVKDHFELKAWVCVSDDFDSFNITNVIYQSVGGEHKDFADLNLLQVALRDRLMGKKFLLILDDIWSDKLEDWETLAGPFFAGAPGSKIIITTRKKELLRQLGHHHPYDLKKLSPKDALSLLAQQALGVKDFDSYPLLRPHGEGIIRKSDCLPLALKALGSLLRTKADEEDWRELLNNEIWMLEDGGGIVPALRLSFNDLSACLKQLFAYCCLIPKDYVFEKKDLILLWMAEGFLYQSTTSMSMERLGEQYFEELLSRSFFQQVPDDESLFVMHDLMNDLATFVAGEFFIRLDIDMKKDVEALKKVRHMSFVCETFTSYKKFKAFERTSSLRTFLGMPNVMKDDSWQAFYLPSRILDVLLPELPMLRVLCLKNIILDKVPECVGNMKHLRYLNLSRTRITHLPENVCDLYNLQTLIVSGCHNLAKLPDNFLKLKNLQHFDIRDTLLWNMMPLGINEFKSLQTLSNIIVGGRSDFFLSGLKNLKNHQGKISIRGLDKVQSARDIKEVKLSQKRVSELEVKWSDMFDDSRNKTVEKEVLNALKPHSDNLKVLKIKWYGGKVFPNWIVDHSFLQLTSVSIWGCRNCMFLPPLGQLPSLKKLFIHDLNEVKVVSSEFLGTGFAFHKLEKLSFYDMRGWEVCSTNSGVAGEVFPCLQELTLVTCPNLAEVSLEALPYLRVLEVRECGDGVLTSLVQAASLVAKLIISGVSDEVWRGVMGYLGAVEEISITDCNEISYLWESEAEASKVLVNLRKLNVGHCSKLVSLGEKEEKDNSRCNLLSSLRKLRLWECHNLKHCNCPNNIQELSISNCNSITFVSFPTVGGRQKLKTLNIDNCELLEQELINTNMTMLEVVHIFNWSNLTSIVELTCFIHLAELIIEDCASMESFPAADLPNLTSLKRLTIKNCKSMNVASFGVWPPKLELLRIGDLRNPVSKWGAQNFPSSLVDLQLWGGSAEEDDVTSSIQLSHILPLALTRLELWGFKNMESVSVGLEHLTSLQHLQIWECQKMKDLPETLLPSLLSLSIVPCPDNLNEKLSRGGSYWPLISHISNVNIY